MLLIHYYAYLFNLFQLIFYHFRKNSKSLLFQLKQRLYQLFEVLTSLKAIHSFCCFMLRSAPTNHRLHSNHSIMPQSLTQHKCYFHNTNNINKFCINKKCTLPLCEKCIPIHVKQHSKEQKTLGKENIILYLDAHKIAVQQLASILSKKQQSIQIFQQTVKNIRKQLQQIIDNEIGKIEKIIQSKGNEVKILSQKYTKIKKGSLKALIFYFADEESFKITSQTNKDNKSTIADQIIKLSEKLFYEVKKFETDGISSRLSLDLISNRNNQTSKPKQKVTSSIQNHNQKSMRLETSADFDKVLKDQKQRLQNVRNKNLLFATNYGEITQNENFKRYGSKSVDSFYSNKNLYENQEIKEEMENRPLQFGFKNNSQSYSMKKQNDEECLNTQLTIDKIRRKYNGDQSMSKQKVGLTEQNKRQPLKTVNINDSKSVKFDARQRIFSDRIPDRETIRSSIENKIQQKMNKNDPMTKKQLYLGPEMKQQKHETFRRPQKPQENASKVKQQEFTLNKNQGFIEIPNKNLDKQKALMSSIKKELKVVPMDEARPKQGMCGHFFESKDGPTLNSFDAKQGKRTEMKEIIKQQQVNDIVIDKLGKSGQQNLSKNQFMSRKEKLYEDTKQRIKLSQPTENKIDYLEKESQQQKQRAPTISNTLKSDKPGKEGRRFNYLYDTQNTIN